MHGGLPTGKVPWDLVAKSLGSRLPPEVVLGPGAGEDAALVKIGGELWAVATDPISLAAADAGRLAVTVNANDVAVRGATPRFFLVVLMLAPDEATEDLVGGILRQVREACDAIDVALIGGHTEVTQGLSHSLVVGTMLGRVTGRPITTGGLRTGDLVGLTKWVGLEGTSILLSEFGPRLMAVHPVDAFARCLDLLESDWLSVIPEAAVAAANSAVNAMHDVTEGGIGEALYEMERASGLGIEVDVGKLPMLTETKLICDDLGMDPMGLIGSGSLLVGCSPKGRHGLEADLADAGVRFSWIGRVVAERGTGLRSVPRFERDEILKALCVQGIEAVVFDMDGTLIDSEYDWPAIRRRLGVTAPSIIDELNGLPDAERESKWRELRSIERRATLAAELREGATALLALLRERGLVTALVTNNSDDNTRLLLDRFDLDFDVVLTRDSGLWKPSGEPIAEAVRRLGVAPNRVLAVGDSRYDLDAAGEAGCGRVCVLYRAAERYREHADLAFADLESLTRYLQIVL
jgi:HAD superfamily hydrolase (TIGR01509 family)